jgi:hypothetical protein
MGQGHPGHQYSNITAIITEENPAIDPTDRSKLPLISTIAWAKTRNPSMETEYTIDSKFLGCNKVGSIIKNTTNNTKSINHIILSKKNTCSLVLFINKFLFSVSHFCYFLLLEEMTICAMKKIFLGKL